MKRGFTMIELIFVIVILGILAAVAIPRLAATRDDATVARLASDLATVTTDAGARWTAQGSWPENWDDLTNVGLSSTAGGEINSDFGTEDLAYLNAAEDGEAANGCFSLALTGDGSLTIIALSDGTSPACEGAKEAARANSLVGADDDNRTHAFGGSRVRF